MNNNTISEMYNIYKDKYRPWLIEIQNDLGIDDLAVLDDEVGGLVFLNVNGKDLPHLDTIINSLNKSIINSRKIKDEILYLEVVLNLSIMLSICNLLKK